MDSESDNSDEISPLVMLPTEVFLYICNYLDAKFLAQSVRLVCRKFNSILGDPSVWKHRISRKIKNKFPPLPVDEAEFDWLESCCSIEYEYDHWKNYEKDTVTLKDTEHFHIGDVDSVLLLNSGDLCITGSRDRSIVFWTVKREPEPQVACSFYKLDAHEGWIWCLLVKESKLFSCSWDNTIKCWDISVGMQEVDSADCRTAVLSIATTDESSLLASGMFRGAIEIFDVRTKLKPCKNYECHVSSILAMSMFGNTLVSANEAGSITAWDMRTDQRLAKIDIKRKTAGYVKSLSYEDNVLYAGDSKGNLHLLEPKEMKLVETYNLENIPRIVGLKYTRGCIIAGCEDLFCVMTPTSPPQVITDLCFNNRPGAFDYLNGILATGCAQGEVEFMIPTK